VEDAAGRRRILKIVQGLGSDAVADFLSVHHRLQEASGNRHLMPILAFGADADVVWEEFPLADPADPGEFDLQSYCPLEPDRGRTGDGVVSTVWVATVGLGVVEALIHLDSLGLTHGDVKPGNLLRFGGCWVLADFDTVGPRNKEGVVSPSTEGYRPPGGERGTGSDCYAVGKLMYELWTGLSRLEYPTLPRHLLTGPRWTRRDQLLNETLHALCSPMAMARLGNLGVLRSILQILSTGDAGDLSRVDRILSGRRRSGSRGLAVVMGIALLGATALAWRSWLPRSDETMDIEGNRVAWTHYHHPQAINEGHVRRASDGLRDGWILFNVHGTLLEPVETGDHFTLDMKKDAWRGHVGVYLSDRPFYEGGTDHGFGHRDGFGGLTHLMWFHLDGNSLVAPTAAEEGREVALDPADWSPKVRTNTLAPYHLELSVGEDLFRWTISTGDLELASGSHPRRENLRFLGFYVYDNTLCYLTGLRRLRTAGGRPEIPGGAAR